MSFEQIVTYIILPIIAGITAIWGTVKFIIPKVADRILKIIESRANAEIEGEKTTREYQQKMEQLEQSYLLSEASVAQQRMADLLEDSQGTLKTIYFDGIDKIKTDTSQIPLVIIEIKALQIRVDGLETRQRLLIGIITRDLAVGDDQSAEDYDTWKKNQPPRQTQENA